MEKNEGLSALDAGELELFVQTMEPWKIENIGNIAWIDWHTRLQKLNQQAVLEATAMLEEQTKETLISFGKLPVLVHEAICIQVWRLKIFPHLLKMQPEAGSGFGVYMVLYHEAVAAGALETVLFHEASADCLAAVSVDLLLYAADMLGELVHLIADGYFEEKNKTEELSVSAELKRQHKDLVFDIGMRCVSIIRYMAEHVTGAGGDAGVAHSVYRAADVPSLVAHLLQAEPWKRRNAEGKLLYFNYGRWTPPTDEDVEKMHRTEAQLWLCLRQLLLEPKLQNFYTIDNVRKVQFCKLESRLSDAVLDQLPPLADLKLFLCRLALAEIGALGATTGGDPGCLLIQVVPQIKESYLASVSGRSKRIAREQWSRLSADGSPESRALAKRLLESYTSDAALALEGGGARCAGCGARAASRCSRCRHEWYCGRECQVKSWCRHKELCDQLSQLAL